MTRTFTTLFQKLIFFPHLLVAHACTHTDSIAQTQLSNQIRRLSHQKMDQFRDRVHQCQARPNLGNTMLNGNKPSTDVEQWTHPWQSSRRSYLELWSGMVHGKGWCSSSYAGKPSTSLFRDMGTSVKLHTLNVLITYQSIHASVSDGSACYVISWSLNSKI